MPDVRQAEKFIRLMTAEEQRYLRRIRETRRQVRRALLDILDRDGISRASIAAMQRELDALTQEVNRAAGETSREVRRIVKNYTQKQLEMVKKARLPVRTDINILEASALPLSVDAEQSIMLSEPAWLQQLKTRLQTQSAQLRISSASEEEIRARLLAEDMQDGRASVWRASEAQADNEETRNVWAYALGMAGLYLALFNEGEQQVEYKKQAIATIDERTTDCCLRVHGQIQPIDEPFHLTGTPRFADYVQDPPFHWYCRTTEVLYHEAFEEFGVTTDQLRDAANAELDARERTGKREEIYPSHATARRK